MQRLEYDRYGGPENVRLSAFTLPAPAVDEVVVRVAAASINPMDWKIRAGQLRLLTGFKFPRAMGADFSGTVEAVGAQVTRFKPGDDVLGSVSMKASGAFAEKLVANQGNLVKKPENLSFAAAACLPVAGVTAWLALVKKAQLKRGQSLFVNGALGAVGQAAVAIARGIGAGVAGRVGPRSLAQGQALGLSPALDYTQPLPASLGAYDVVFDCNGALSAQEARRLKKPGGVIVDIVPSGAKIFKALFSRSQKIVFADLRAENLQQVVDLAAAGKLAIPIVRTVALAEAPALLAALERGERVNGKAVIAF